MAEEKRVDPYLFEDGFERVVVALLACNREFYERFGPFVEPAAFANPSAKEIARLTKLMAKTMGRGPGSRDVVLQSFAEFARSGKATIDQKVAAAEYLVPLPADFDHEPYGKVFADVIQKRLQTRVVFDATQAMTQGKLISERTAEQFSRLHEVGRVEVFGSEGLDGDIQIPPKTTTGISALDHVMEGGLVENGVGVYCGGPKQGKCHKKGQGILMHDGSIKAVERIEVGDLLASPTGEPRRVLATNRGRGMLYEIRPNKRGGKPWVVNLDHILTLVRSRKAVGCRDKNANEVVDVSLREWMTLPEKQKHHLKLLRAPVEVFGGERVSLPLDPYFLGLLLGDGNFSHSIVGVTSMDEEVVAEVACQAAKHRMKIRETSNGSKAHTYWMSKREGALNPISSKLQSLGLRFRNSGTKFIPEIYKRASVQDRRRLLAGLIDSDGCRNLTSYDFCFKSEQLARDVEYVARSLGFGTFFRSIERRCQTGGGGIYFRISISGDSHKLPVRVKRKKSPRRKRNYDVLRSGFTVHKHGIGDYYGFTLDGDGRYLLDDFTVTHNSMAMSGTAAAKYHEGKFVAYLSTELPIVVQRARVCAAIIDMPISSLQRNDPVALAKLKAVRQECESRGANIQFKRADLDPKKSIAGWTFDDVLFWLDRLAKDFKRHPDILVIDYADHLYAKGVKDSYTTGFIVYARMVDTAQKRHMQTWTACQGTRQKKEVAHLGLYDFSDSMHKVRLVDLAITISPGEKGFSILKVVADRYVGATGTELDPLPIAHSHGYLVQSGRIENSNPEPDMFEGFNFGDGGDDVLH